MKFNRDLLINIAVIFGIIAAITMAIGVSLVAAAIASIILGGSMTFWSITMFMLDIIIFMYFFAKLQDEVLEGGLDERKTPME
jgi:hypothetical protein